MLVTSIFSFSHNVFTLHYTNLFPFILSSANAFNLVVSKILLVGKELSCQYLQYFAAEVIGS